MNITYLVRSTSTVDVNRQGQTNCVYYTTDKYREKIASGQTPLKGMVSSHEFIFQVILVSQLDYIRYFKCDNRD